MSNFDKFHRKVANKYLMSRKDALTAYSQLQESFWANEKRKAKAKKKAVKKAREDAKAAKKKKKRPPKRKKQQSDDYTTYMKSAEWREKSKMFREQAGCCEKCGYVGNLACHHKHYNTLGYEEREDIEVLCYRCHCNAHGTKKFYNPKKKPKKTE